MQARQELVEAYAFYQALTQMIRLCLTGNFDRHDVPPGLADLLLAVTGLPDFGVLEAHLKDMAATVRRHFDRLLPAAKKKRSGRDL
jgi:glutamate-ammonia-ligase adenylyltransferase